MTFSDFLAKFNGQNGVGNTLENKGQCTGLANVFIVDYLKKSFIWGNAKDFINNYNPKDFEVILNTPDAIPQQSDIVIWGQAYNGNYGHVGVATGTGDLNSFECFVQNDPLGSNCHLKTYNYNSVLGWLKPLSVVEPSPDTIQVLKTDFENMRRKCDIYDTIINEHHLNIADNSTMVIADVDRLLTVEQAVQDKDKQLVDANTKVTGLEQQLKDLIDKNIVMAKDNEIMAGKVEKQDQTIKTYAGDLRDAQTSLTDLKNQLQKPVITGWKLWLYNTFIK